MWPTQLLSTVINRRQMHCWRNGRGWVFSAIHCALLAHKRRSHHPAFSDVIGWVLLTIKCHMVHRRKSAKDIDFIREKSLIPTLSSLLPVRSNTISVKFVLWLKPQGHVCVIIIVDNTPREMLVHFKHTQIIPSYNHRNDFSNFAMKNPWCHLMYGLKQCRPWKKCGLFVNSLL